MTSSVNLTVIDSVSGNVIPKYSVVIYRNGKRIGNKESILNNLKNDSVYNIEVNASGYHRGVSNAFNIGKFDTKMQVVVKLTPSRYECSPGTSKVINGKRMVCSLDGSTWIPM
jgi:hypothetical protein